MPILMLMLVLAVVNAVIPILIVGLLCYFACLGLMWLWMRLKRTLIMDEKRSTDKWTSDKTYNVPNILAALTVVGSFSGWLIFETSRITTLEVQQAYAREEVIKVAAQAKDDLARVASLLHDNQQEVAAALIRIEGRQIGNEKPTTK